MEETTKRIIEIDIDLGASSDRLAEVTKELDDLRKNSNELKKENTELLESVRKGEKQWSDVSKTISENSKQLADNEAKTKQLKAEQSALQGQITETTKKNRVYGDSYRELSTKLADMKNAYRSLDKEQRESDGGKKMLAEIQALDKEMKNADASIGNFQRNVGNYKSALGDLKDSMEATGASTKGLNSVMKLLGKNPLMLFLGLVVGLLVKLRDGLQQSEQMTASFTKATASLQPVLETTGKWIGKIADLLSNVLDWAIQKAIDSIGWLGRQLQKVGKLVNKDWGSGLIDFSVKMGESMNKTEETTVAIEEGTEKLQQHTKAVKEDTKAVEDNNKELEKQAEEYRKLTETEMQKAEDALNNIIEDAFEKRRAIEETNYKRQHDSLLNAMVAEEEAHGTQTELYQAYMTQWEALETQHQQNLLAIKQDKADKEKAINAAKVADDEKTAAAQKRIEQSRLQYATQIAGGLSDLMEAVAGENKAMVKASKIVALAEVAIKQGVAIAEAVASSAAGDPYTYALRVAAAIASTIAAMASAISSINSVKLARGTSYVQGPGTSTSDSIPAMLSKGEGVVNARANQMFPGVVGAMNDASVGIWSPLMSMLRSSGGAPAQVASPMQMTEIQMANAFRNAVSDLDMYVSVEEINRGQRSVKVVENLGSM